MNPVAFSIGSFDIRWYGVMITLGIFVAFLITYINCKKRNLDFEKVMDIFLISFPFAIICARAYYVIFEWDRYKDNIIEIFNIRGGGIAIHGALIGAIVAAFIYCKMKKISFIKYADLIVPAVIVAQGIGRWGNFFNSEAHGRAVSESFISKFPEFIQKGMYIDGSYYHPTFLYESVWNMFVGLILIFILYKFANKYKGIVICSYGSLYSIGRYFIEGLRTDSLYIGDIRVAQLVSLTTILISCIGIVYIILKERKKNI